MIPLSAIPGKPVLYDIMVRMSIIVMVQLGDLSDDQEDGDSREMGEQIQEPTSSERQIISISYSDATISKGCVSLVRVAIS